MTMQILITRNWSKKDYTVGRILVNGEFVCNSLELPVKTKEGDKGSRIPCGTYTIKKRYSPKFKRQVLWITRNGDTAFNYRFILFHAGNIVNDTQGCVLTGINDRIGWLSSSRKYEYILFGLADGAMRRGESVTLKITS